MDRVSDDQKGCQRPSQQDAAYHAISHEVTSIVVSLPILIWLGGLGWKEALLADIGLTIFYMAYALVFYRIYDAMRPVQTVNLQGIKT